MSKDKSGGRGRSCHIAQNRKTIEKAFRRVRGRTSDLLSRTGTAEMIDCCVNAMKIAQR